MVAISCCFSLYHYLYDNAVIKVKEPAYNFGDVLWFILPYKTGSSWRMVYCVC